MIKKCTAGISFGLGLFVLSLMQPALSSASEMIEIGGGVHSVLNSAAPSALIEVKAEGSIVRLRAELAIATESDAERLPYLDIKFVPAEIGASDDIIEAKIGFAPIQIRRNLPNGEKLSVQVSVSQVSVPVGYELTPNTVVFAQLALDAIGYKLKTYLEGASFQGFHMGGLEMVAGVQQRLSELFSVRVYLGVNTDLNIGSSNGFSIQSDISLYTRVAVDVGTFVRLFAQLAYMGTMDSANRSVDFGPVFLGGLTFVF